MENGEMKIFLVICFHIRLNVVLQVQVSRIR